MFPLAAENLSKLTAESRPATTRTVPSMERLQLTQHDTITLFLRLPPILTRNDPAPLMLKLPFRSAMPPFRMTKFPGELMVRNCVMLHVPSLFRTRARVFVWAELKAQVTPGATVSAPEPEIVPAVQSMDVVTWRFPAPVSVPL